MKTTEMLLLLIIGGCDSGDDDVAYSVDLAGDMSVPVLWDFGANASDWTSSPLSPSRSMCGKTIPTARSSIPIEPAQGGRWRR